MTRLPDPLHARFLAPSRAGPLEGATSFGEASNAACGDHLRLELRARGGAIDASRFQARGCSAVIALADLLAERLEGLALAEAALLDVAALARAAGGLPRARSHAAGVAQRALDAALADPPGRCHP